MKLNARQRALAAGLTATLIATVFAPSPVKESISAPVVQQVSTIRDVSVTRTDGALRIPAVKPRIDEEETGTIFLASIPAETKHAAEIKKPVEDIAPQAPPLPFRYLGRHVKDGRIGVFLMVQDDDLVAFEGDQLLETYHVEHVDDKGVTFRYLPLDQLQTLSISEIR